MNKKEIIEQLESIRAHCKDMIKYDEMWKSDVEALDYAINAINNCKCSILHRFNAGDKVIVRDNLVVGQWYDGLLFNKNMEEYKDKSATIEIVMSDNYILDKGIYFFNDEMLERVE